MLELGITAKGRKQEKATKLSLIVKEKKNLKI